MTEIYIDPKAIEAANKAFHACYSSPAKSFADSLEAAYHALIQYIVDNPRQLSDGERKELASNWGSTWQDVFNESVRLLFTKPTPSIPDKVVELIDKYIPKLPADYEDNLRELALKCFEAGKAAD